MKNADRRMKGRRNKKYKSLGRENDVVTKLIYIFHHSVMLENHGKIHIYIHTYRESSRGLVSHGLFVAQSCCQKQEAEKKQ